MHDPARMPQRLRPALHPSRRPRRLLLLVAAALGVATSAGALGLAVCRHPLPATQVTVSRWALERHPRDVERLLERAARSGRPLRIVVE